MTMTLEPVSSAWISLAEEFRACRERGCALFWGTTHDAGDPESVRCVWQHGDNPEAVLIFDIHTLTPDSLSDQATAWFARCHEYDDARATA